MAGRIALGATRPARGITGRIGRALALIAALALGAPAFAQTLQDTPARAALVVDLSSGATLLDKNADERLPPASMLKLMTLYMVFEALERGGLSLEDEFRTSPHAASMGGSKMFIREGELVSVESLLRGVIVQSGNDAAVALAEGLAGTEEHFAERMNQRAAELGLTNSHFANATGWPHPDQFMSSRDLVHLATLIIENFPDYYAMFAETDFTWDDVHQENRNPLLSLGIGADGLKTGHTEEAGYGLVGSAKRGDRRIVMAIAGLGSSGERAREAERLINWAFTAFETRELYAKGEALAEAPVWIGSATTVGLAPARDVVITAPYGNIDRAALKVVYDGPVPAPIEAGDRIGRLEILVPDLPPVTVPLVATEAVAPGGFLTRVQAAAELLLGNVIPDGLPG
jgi:D-alanyl-D-alanine carboxypeptidase (penicillin-binding protein 5/6)